MNSPRSGFRRAAATSWALAGVGVAGVAGASTLAYADTFKPPIQTPAEVAIPAAPDDFGPPSAVDSTPVPDAATPTVDPPPDPAPVTTETPHALAPVTAEAPVQRYPPEQTYEQAPAPVTHVAPAPTKVSTAPTTKRRVNTPTMVQSPNYSPHVSVSRGS